MDIEDLGPEEALEEVGNEEVKNKTIDLDKEVNAKIGGLLRKTREERGLPQEYVSKRMRLSRVALIEIENGNRALRIGEFLRIAVILRLNAREVLREVSRKYIENEIALLEEETRAQRKLLNEIL